MCTEKKNAEHDRTADDIRHVLQSVVLEIYEENGQIQQVARELSLSLQDAWMLLLAAQKGLAQTTTAYGDWESYAVRIERYYKRKEAVALLCGQRMFFASTFCIKLQKGFVGCCTYIL